MSKYKVCSQCKKKKPCEAFYKDKSRTCGFRSNCKKCCEPNIKKVQEALKLKTKLKKQALLDRGGKECRECKEFKNFSELYDWIIKNDFHDGFQILCANCNTIKKIENKENPWNKKES